MSILAICKALLDVVPFRFTILKSTTRSFEIFNLGIRRPAGRIHHSAARENCMQQKYWRGGFHQARPETLCRCLFLEDGIRHFFVHILGPVLLFFPIHRPGVTRGKAESLDSYAVLWGRGLEQIRREYPDGNCFKLTASPSLLLFLQNTRSKDFPPTNFPQKNVDGRVVKHYQRPHVSPLNFKR